MGNTPAIPNNLDSLLQSGDLSRPFDLWKRKSEAVTEIEKRSQQSQHQGSANE
jgi:hypothetical protein